MPIALYIGRFQPLHKGHLEYIKKILNENDSLIIVIGSFGKSDKINPFTIKERKEMLKLCFREENILDKIKIVAVKDFPGDNVKWLDYVLKKVGKFDTYYSGENNITRKIFSEAGFKVKTHERIDNISGTQIRELIKQGKEWKHLVPRSVFDYMVKKNKI